MQHLLYNKSHIRRDTFTYEINSGGELDVKECGVVAIHFVNGKFERAEYPMHDKYTRNGWRILAVIEVEIAKLEKEMTETA